VRIQRGPSGPGLNDIYRTGSCVYTSIVTKRLIDIDDDLLAEARELADAETIKGTVEEALRKLVRIEITRLHIEELAESLEPNAVELLEKNRRPTPPPGGFPD